jgi:hypothetical protein
MHRPHFKFVRVKFLGRFLSLPCVFHAADRSILLNLVTLIVNFGDECKLRSSAIIQCAKLSTNCCCLLTRQVERRLWRWSRPSARVSGSRTRSRSYMKALVDSTSWPLCSCVRTEKESGWVPESMWAIWRGEKSPGTSGIRNTIRWFSIS